MAFRATDFRSRLSVVGFAIALLAAMFHLTLFVLELAGGSHNPYASIVFHLLLPPLLGLGFGIALFGAWRARRRREGAPASDATAHARHLTALRVFVTLAVVALLALPFLVYTSYAGYRYTESERFCGGTCHPAMEPMHVAHEASGHSSVACANCHIGEGATWYVLSKLTGTRHLYRFTTNTYHRPIETPVRAMRPASEVCETCHSRNVAHGTVVRSRTFTRSDEKNTEQMLTLALKIGGGDSNNGAVHGIHWHAASDATIDFVAVDEHRLEIPWVRVTDPRGVRVYRSDGFAGDAPPPAGEHRTMDCTDCHNRSGHRYQAVGDALDERLASGRLDRSWPYLKREALRLATAKYTDRNVAEKAITEGLETFYAARYADLLRTRHTDFDRTAAEVVAAYRSCVFPEMNTDARSHPDHEGHWRSPGCFRCHDDAHRASDGAVIEKTCETCHDVLQSTKTEKGLATTAVPFAHPWALEGTHATLACDACHRDADAPTTKCEGCHADIAAFAAGTLPLVPGVTAKPDPGHVKLACVDCHEEISAPSWTALESSCGQCHEKSFTERAEREVTALRAARIRATDALRRVGANPSDRTVFRRLEAVGPGHNRPYAVAVFEALADRSHP